MNQTHPTRQHLIYKLQKELKRNVITFFTSTHYPVAIHDVDNDMIEGMLKATDKNMGVTLILNSPGGSALAAEKIITTCRTYSNGDFEVIVPRMAKSAATMICMGAKRIWMSKSAELGPIDPQVVIITHDGTPQLRGAHYLIESYKELFKKAVETKGNIEPYLQQLERYDARDIREYENMVELAKDIALRSLKTGMMKGLLDDDILAKIERFTDPAKTKTHGRPICLDEARQAGLKVEEIDIRSETWTILWELYLRSDLFVRTARGSKLCESTNDSFTVPAPSQGE